MNNQVLAISEWLGVGSINIFGRPFAGKDTQGRKLADLFGGELIAGGDILRSYHDQEKIKQIMSKGELIPTDFYLEIMLPFLSKPELKSKPLILSSVGRLKGEEPIITEATQSSGHPIKAVILLQLAEEDCWNHFEKSKDEHDRGNRPDDKKEVLKTRLHEFQNKTIPVLEYYRDKGLLIEVDGTQSREVVTQEILDSLNNFASA